MIQTAAHGPPRILLVEDEPLIRMMAADMLDLLGFVVVEAERGSEALALASDPQNAFDALMIDLGLPDQPGEQVIRAIRDLRPALPVIVTTGADTVAAAHRLRDCAPVSFLEKPYYLKDLERTVAPLTAVV